MTNNYQTLTVTTNAVTGDIRLDIVGSWKIGKDSNTAITGTISVLFTVVTIVNPDDLAIEITPT